MAWEGGILPAVIICFGTRNAKYSPVVSRHANSGVREAEYVTLRMAFRGGTGA